MTQKLRIGVVSDTHSLLRPQAVETLRGVHRIIHAGDVGSREVLLELGAVAPLVAVRGNNDHGAWARALPDTARVELGGVSIYVVHDVHDLNLDPRAAGIAAVISGHSHKPLRETRDGVLYFNPGSIGPRRFRLPISMGFLTIAGARVKAELVTLA
jgi:putative phosphoesterase